MGKAGKSFTHFLLLLLFSTTRSIDAFIISNNSSRTIYASIQDIYSATIHPGKQGVCHWTDCDGQRFTVLPTWITMDTTVNVVSLQAGGRLEVNEDSTNWNWPKLSLIAPPVYIDVYSPIPESSGMVRYYQSWPYINKRGLGYRNVHFMVTADPQYFNHWGTWNHKAVPDKTLATMKNLLRGDMRGIIIAGDLTQNANSKDFDAYYAGIDGHARYVFDGIGNHDMPSSKIYNNIRDRKRISPRSMASDGQPHYSWNWDDVHFVQLNEYPGKTNNGLLALSLDLTFNVGTSNNPVVLIHHYGFDGFSKQDRWWTEQDRLDYYHVIKGYRVIAFFTGHLHTPSPLHQYCWDERFLKGSVMPFFIGGAARGDNGDGRGFFLEVTISQNTLTVIRRSGDNGEERERVSVDLLKKIPRPGGCDSFYMKKTMKFFDASQEILNQTSLPVFALNDAGYFEESENKSDIYGREKKLHVEDITLVKNLEMSNTTERLKQ